MSGSVDRIYLFMDQWAGGLKMNFRLFNRLVIIKIFGRRSLVTEKNLFCWPNGRMEKTEFSNLHNLHNFSDFNNFWDRIHAQIVSQAGGRPIWQGVFKELPKVSPGHAMPNHSLP
jgi:hypothetical protein